MKLKQFGLLTAASLALVACSNESDPVLGGEDNAPKKVVLKLEGISQGTKSTDGNTTDEGSKKHSVSLKDVAIFLYADGGVIYEAKEVGSSASEWNDIATTGITFDNVDPAVNKVMVIGNYDNLEINNIFGAATSLVNTKAADLLAETISLKSQNVSAQESDGQTTSTKAVMTLFGKTENNITDSDGDGIYEAAVSIKPIVSRLEVSKVSCKFVTPAGSGISQSATVEVNGIGLFDYYNTMTLGGTALTQLMDATKILEPGTSSASDGQYVFLGDAADWTWAYDKTESSDYSNTLQGDGPEKTVEMTKTAGGSATFAYNFFPVTSGSTIDGTLSDATDQVLANIRLRVKVTDGAESGKDYVVTTAFRNSAGQVVNPEPGKIYQFDYAFETTNIRDNWSDDEIKVNVTVTTVDWDIVAVTPSF